MMAADQDLLGNVGKLIGGAAIVGGTGWAVFRRWLSDRRSDGVAAAQARADTASFDVYDRTIAMLRTDIEQIRADKAAADVKWRQDMQTLEERLRVLGAQADTAIDRARTAEAVVDKLRAQLRALNVEPCA